MSIIYPLIWNEQQYEEIKRKNSWMYAINGKIGCTSCREVNNLGMRASRAVIISARWAEGNVTSCGSTREPQLSSLRKKSTSAKTLKHIKKLSIFLKQQRKTYCLTWMHKVIKQSFNLLLGFSEQRIMSQKITNLSPTLKVWLICRKVIP